MIPQIRSTLICCFLLFGYIFQANDTTGIWSIIPIKPSRDLAFWYGFKLGNPSLYYNPGGNKGTHFVSNSRLGMNIGVDYASYTLQYTFRLPIKLLAKDAPISGYFELGTGYASDHFEIDAYISKMDGFYDISNFMDSVRLPFAIDPRYRKDLTLWRAGFTAFYYINDQFRYSPALKNLYKLKRSGYTFYASMKNRYQLVTSKESILPPEAHVDQNTYSRLKSLSVYETSMSFGISGILTNEHWFLAGLVGFGPGIQFQHMTLDDKRPFRPFISPVVDAMLSIGYRTEGFILGIHVPLNLMFIYIPQESLLIHFFPQVSLNLSFRIQELISKQKRTLKNHASL